MSDRQNEDPFGNSTSSIRIRLPSVVKNITITRPFESIFHNQRFELGEYTVATPSWVHFKVVPPFYDNDGVLIEGDADTRSAARDEWLNRARLGEWVQYNRALPEEVRDIFFAGVKKLHLHHPTMTTPIDVKEYEGMYREFSDWLMERRDNFVLEYIIDNEVLRHSNFWVKGTATVYAELGMQWIYLSTELST